MSEKFIAKKIIQVVVIIAFIYLFGYIIGQAFYFFKSE